MRWVDGEMIAVAYKEGADTLAFTANSVIKKDGSLVMGGGAAKRVADFFPETPAALGAKITSNPDRDFLIAEAPVSDLCIDRVLAVQVKRHFKDDGDLDLTKAALNALAKWCISNPKSLVVLNCPLIGLGGFAHRIDEVKQAVSSILKDSNVIVCIQEAK